ncbi:MFS transporter, FSR family, fosmidomycin resistance protein [Ensifer adhaerens]|nr:MFS transporter, FSR family, fosmidomycin resistance protein [Ensifer adhaerens]
MSAVTENATPLQASNPSTNMAKAATGPAMAILIMISVSHMLNDLMQSVVPSVYPILKDKFQLSYADVGLLTFTWQLTASILQPGVGFYTDKHPKPFSLAFGMGCTLIGLILMAFATSYHHLLIGVAAIGVGSSIFHPESSRVARMASGGRHGFAQSLFQVGGNFGSAIGPLLAMLLVVEYGKNEGAQHAISYFGIFALAGMAILTRVGFWYSGELRSAKGRTAVAHESPVSRGVLIRSIGILCALIFSKFLYMASLSSYYIFYTMQTFKISTSTAQLLLFVYLGSVAAGTIAGGPIGDKIGRRRVIWFSILGVLPFTLLLPFANLTWTVILTIPIGFILASAFPAIVVYAQELVPGKPGTIAGLFFGFAFGMGGIGAALLGVLADHTSIGFVYQVCSVLPAIGLLAIFLPDVRHKAA